MTSLYVHIPFCRSKCPYCDFFSVPAAEVPSSYIDLLLQHLRSLPRDGGTLETIFFGGGTPSLLGVGQLGAILEAASDHFGIASTAEISLEANPGTVTVDRLAGYAGAGVNRINFGIQSLCDRALQRLGRIHSAADGERVVDESRRAGFSNVGIDLIFAQPGQGTDAFLQDLARGLALDPQHLSLYGLTVEEGTPFHSQLQEGELLLPDEEVYVETFLAADDLLRGRGFCHYEISNYARPGRECRHNLVYWRRLPSLAIGAGGHSFSDSGWGERRAVPQDLEAYAVDLRSGGDPARLLESFDRTTAMSETLYLGLRTAEGVDEESFRRRFGCGVAEAFPEGVARAGKHLALREGRWSMDREGWLVFDHLIEGFLPG